MSVATTAIIGPLASGAWCAGGVSQFRVPFADPGGRAAEIVSWALEYVAPLNTWLDELVGDEGQVARFSSTWRGVAADLTAVETDLRASDGRLDLLVGRTARALRKRYDEIRAQVRDVGEWTAAVSAALDLASGIVTAIHDAIVGALSELAAIITDLFGFTLNPFSKLEHLESLIDHVMAFVEVIGTLIERMFSAFGELVRLLGALIPLIADGLHQLRILLGQLLQAAGPILGGPLGGLLTGAASDLLAGDARVTELDPSTLTDEQREAWLEANGTGEVSTFSDLVAANGLTDTMGQGDRSVVDIKKVLGPDGTYHWVVSLPSTQDWGMLKGMFGEDFVDTLKDYPPTNDLDSNIALMLMDNPWLATQYERAVMQAMSDAGVPAGADVVYTGFSQGGIMAANLASNGNSPYNVVGVVTNGSPIDSFPIPPEVRVVSFEHVGDPVPLLDGHGVDATDAIGNATSNHQKVPLFAPGILPGDTHNNANYVDSVAAGYDQYSQDYPEFFGTVVDHQQHTWGE